MRLIVPPLKLRSRYRTFDEVETGKINSLSRFEPYIVDFAYAIVVAGIVPFDFAFVDVSVDPIVVG